MRKSLLALVSAILLTTLSVPPAHAAGAWEIDTLSAGTSDVALIAADAANSRRQRVFCGFSALETGGAATANVRIYNGTDANGELLFSFSLAISESRSEGPWAADECLPCPDGVFIDRGGTGTTLLTVYTRLR